MRLLALRRRDCRNWGLKGILLFTVMAVFLAAGMMGCGSPPPELTVSAAASLSDVMNDLGKAFEESKGGTPVNFSFASSGALATQIEQGAPADVFVSADPAKVDALADKGLAAPGTDLVGNGLVLIAPADSEIKGFEDLTGPGVKRIALGIPETVPAGQYGKQVLQYMGLWDRIQDKIIPSKDVRQVLTYVAQGETDAGLVYSTDAAISSGVKVVAAAPSGSHDPIRYSATVVGKSAYPQEARRFVDFLLTEEAKAIWQHYGFVVN